MRKTLTTLAVTAAAFAVPMLSTGTAFAADANVSADTTAVSDLLYRAIGGGCTTTYAGAVESTPIGPVYNVTGLTITIYGGTPVAYAGAQEWNTVNYVNCVV